MFNFRNPQFWILTLQIIWIYESSLMSKKLLTRYEMLREKPDCFLLNDLLVLVINGVPKLRLPLMNEIHAREVKVFRMPTKKGLPAANITVRSIDSFYLGLKGIGKKRIKIVEVPSFA